MKQERISRNQENDGLKYNKGNKNEQNLESVFGLIKKSAMANKFSVKRQSSIN